MKNVILLCSIIAFILMQNCTTTRVANSNSNVDPEEGMNSWKGSSKHELILKFGPPTSTASDGNGGEILTYEELKRAYTDSFGYVTFVHKYMFYANSNGIIYHTMYKREGRQGQ
jgi:hypothetical protein